MEKVLDLLRAFTYPLNKFSGPAGIKTLNLETDSEMKSYLLREVLYGCPGREEEASIL